MANYQLTVEERTQTGKSYARKLRADKKIPAVVYGSGKPAMNIEVAVRDVENALASQGSLIELQFGTGTKTVIVKDILRDPVRATLMHVDFHEIDLTQKLETTVPVRVVGEEDRINDGGVVTTLLWEMTVLCLPTDIPDVIEIDVKDLELDQVVTIGEVKLPEGVEAVDEADEPVIRVAIPSLEETETDEDADGDGEVAEPELVGEESEEE